MDEDEVDRLYGSWAGRTPGDAAALLVDYPGRWFVGGGWALEAFTGVHRPHGDLDLSVLRDDLGLLRRHLAGRLDTWAPTPSALWVLLPDDRPDAAADEVLPEGCEQLWTRAGGSQPWEHDVLLTPGTAREWVYRRDPSLRMPWQDATWRADGVDYLEPEIQLLFKARRRRPKDQADLDATVPHLDERRRAWLRRALARTEPGHGWIDRLG